MTILALLIVLVFGFFIRVAVWEEAYYSGMEGTERAVADQVEEEEELIEVEPTEEEVAEYVVAADRPRYLTIEKLGVSKARIISVGSGGTLLIDGHNGGPNVLGVFKDLPSLVYGDIIQVERGDGEIFQYKVVENVTVPLEESNVYMATAMRSPEVGKESVTLISCTGEWSSLQGTYLSRQFTRAVLVDKE